MAHDEVVERYSGLARAALAGETVVDCGPDAFAEGCFGAAGYDDTAELPDGALRASLGCGNPVAVAELRAGETVLDLGSGGGIDVLLSARRVGPHGKAYGLDASPDMVELARRNAERGGRDQRGVPARHDRGHPAAATAVDVVISNCVINLSSDKAAVLAEASGCFGPAGAWASATSSPTARSILRRGRRRAAGRLRGRRPHRRPSTATCCSRPGSSAPRSP